MSADVDINAADARSHELRVVTVIARCSVAAVALMMATAAFCGAQPDACDGAYFKGVNDGRKAAGQ